MKKIAIGLSVLIATAFISCQPEDSLDCHFELRNDGAGTYRVEVCT